MHATQDFSLRSATTADAPAIAGVIRDAFTGRAATTDPKPSAMRETAESVAATLAIGGGAVAIQDGQTVAAVLWHPRDGGLYFGRLAVANAVRGRGIARALVAAVEAEARLLGLSRLLLSTRLVWTDNRRLFTALGFIEAAEHAHPGYSAPTFVDMVKHFPDVPGEAA